MLYSDSFRTYRDIKSVRLQHWIERLYKLNIINKNVIFADLGCGTGRFTIPISKKVLKTYAVDNNPNMLQLAESKGESENTEWILADAINSQLEDSSINVVLTSMLLEHIDNKKALFSEVSRILMKNSYWILRTMLPQDITATTWYSFSQVVHDMEVSRTISLAEIKEYCTNYGLEVESVQSFSDRLTLEEAKKLPERLSSKSYEILHRIEYGEYIKLCYNANVWISKSNIKEFKASSLILIRKL